LIISEVRWSIVPHIENSWFPILKAQYKFISKNNYYFNWVITDDTINISKNWDLEIISKKNMYQDNIFALFTQCDSFGRTPALHRICYDSHLEDKDNGDSIIRHNEMLPILTKDWVLSTWDIFKKGDFSSSRELITSSLLYKLKKTYDINRFIETTVYYSVLENLDTELKKGGVSGDIKNKNGVSRDKAFYTIAADNFTILVPTVNKLYKQINK